MRVSFLGEAFDDRWPVNDTSIATKRCDGEHVSSARCSMFHSSVAREPALRFGIGGHTACSGRAC